MCINNGNNIKYDKGYAECGTAGTCFKNRDKIKLHCAEEMEYFELTEDNTCSFVESFGKKLFKIGDPDYSVKYRVDNNGIEISDSNPLEFRVRYFVPFGSYVVYSPAKKRHIVISKEEFKKSFSVIKTYYPLWNGFKQEFPTE